MSNFWAKNAKNAEHAKNIWARIFKKIVIFEINTQELVKYEYFTHRINFGIGSTFSKGLGSVFSKGAGPDPAPVYKVCLHAPVDCLLEMTKMLK